ncbi:MAG: ABC transporter permease subunit [Myxococcales bacterium]|nr:ABC transporter permease subunit [Myxococcales bacterium]
MTAQPSVAGPAASVGRIWAVALNTFREAARIRVLYGILVLVVASNLLALVMGEMSIREETRVARDVGLAGISLFGSLTAIFLGVFLLYSEVQRRTIHAIVSKPIERWEFVFGKYLGMALVLSVLVALFGLAMALLLGSQGVAPSLAVAKALVLAWAEVLTVAAIAIFFSSFSSPFLSGIFALGLFALGRLTPDIEAAAATAQGTWIPAVATVALELVPDLHLFSISGRMLDGVAVSVHGEFVGWGYVATALGYGALWILGLLAASSLLFQRRDFS